MIGTDTYIDRIIGEYVPPDVERDVLHQLLEDESVAMEYAILKELRALRQARTGGRPIEMVLQDQEQNDEDKEANLYANTHITVEEASQSELEFGFAAQSVLVWGWEEAITIAFSEEGSNREIDLAASKSSFSIGGDVALNASSIYYSKQNGGDPDTPLKVVAQ